MGSVDKLQKLKSSARPKVPGAQPKLTLEQLKAARKSIPELPAASGAAAHLDEARSIRYAVDRGYKALANGDLAEAQRAFDAARKMGKTVDDRLNALARRIEKTKKVLSERVLPEDMLDLRFDHTDDLFKAVGRRNVDRFIGGNHLQSRMSFGDKLRGADELFRSGDLDKAFTRYRSILDEWQTLVNPDQLDNQLMSVLRERMILTKAVRIATNRAKLRRARLTQQGAKRYIKAQEADEVIKRLNDPAGGLKVRQRTGSRNPVFFVEDTAGTKYILKKLDPVIARREAASAALLNAVGGNAPSVRTVQGIKFKHKIIVDATDSRPGKLLPPPPATPNVRGTPAPATPSAVIVSKKGPPAGAKKEIEVDEVFDGVLIRAVDGDPLWNLPESGVLAFREDLALQRAFRLWIGDTDGHMGNQIRGGGWRMWAIDFDMANLLSNDKLSQVSGDLSGLTLKELMKLAVDLPKRMRGHSQYAYMARLDDMLQYQDMLPVLNRMRQLTANNGQKLRLVLKQHLPDDLIDDAVKTLTDRVRPLEDVLRERFAPKLNEAAVKKIVRAISISEPGSPIAWPMAA